MLQERFETRWAYSSSTTRAARRRGRGSALVPWSWPLQNAEKSKKSVHRTSGMDIKIISGNLVFLLIGSIGIEHYSTRNGANSYANSRLNCLKKIIRLIYDFIFSMFRFCKNW
jgi:hypothetical protein